MHGIVQNFIALPHSPRERKSAPSFPYKDPTLLSKPSSTAIIETRERMTQDRNYLFFFNNEAKKKGALISPNKIWALQRKKKRNG